MKKSSSPLLSKSRSTFEFSCLKSKPDCNSLKNNDDFIRLDVGGQTFLTRKHHFASIPQSRLWRLMLAVDQDALQYCDAFHPGVDDPSLAKPVPYYYFDHSGRDFDMILDLYRQGFLHSRDRSSCSMVTKIDLHYWGIDQNVFESCCALKFHQDVQDSTREILEAARLNLRAEEEDEDEDPYGANALGRLRKLLWNITEYPESSTEGKVFVLITIAMITLSVVTFLIGHALENDDLDPSEMTSTDLQIRTALTYLEGITVCFFLLEYITRLACTPNIRKFLLSMLNFADVLAILPFLLSIIMSKLQTLEVAGKAGKLVHLIRVLKVFRIFKLVRHVANLQTLLTTLRQASKELGLLAMMTGAVLVTFATMVYHAEEDESGWTYVESLWWALMTLTTVGYGSLTPKTITGRITGGLCAVTGIFLLTLPIPIIINSFSGYYKNKLIKKIFWIQREKKLRERKKSRALSLAMPSDVGTSSVLVEEEDN